MKPRKFNHTRFSIAVGVVLSALLAGQTLAAQWAQPVAMTSSGEAFAGGLVALPKTSVVVAAYADVEKVLVRRSTDSGATWASATELSGNGGEPAVSGRGIKVDVVWRQDATSAQVIRYARSADGGASFPTSVALSSSLGSGWFPKVARGPDHRVAVTWFDNSDYLNPTIRVRVSRDGGVSFGRETILASGLVSDNGPAVAVGKGVIFVAYTDGGVLRVRRTTDSGTSWSSARVIARGVSGEPSITAAGATAYVAYTASPNGARYVRTTDRGATWSSPGYVSPRAGKPAFRPEISLRHGVVRVVFTRFVDLATRERAIYYRESTDGLDWTKAQRVSVSATPNAWPLGVGFAGKIVVLYAGGSDDTETFDVFGAAGTP
jgi:hypothetical protein